MEFNEKEVNVIKKALDVFIRTRLGRAEQAMDRVTYSGVRSDGRQLTVEETHEAEEFLLKASEILTGIRHGGPGIFSDRVSDEARLALRILGKIEGDKMRVSMVDEDGKRT